MNKDNAASFIPLVQALADGKTIQTTNPDGEWMNTDEPGFMLDIKHYRIKPEPREFIIWMHQNGKYTVPAYKGDTLQQRSIDAGWFEVKAIQIPE